jgi:Tfp pilus assembly protein PilV
MNLKTRQFGRQRGVTLLELTIAAFIMTLVIVSSLKLFSVLTKGVISAKNHARAGNLVSSRLDELQNMAHEMSYSGGWNYVTCSPLAIEYSSVTQISRIDGMSFTWTVSPYYAWVSGTVVDGYTNTQVTEVAAFVMRVEWTDYFKLKSRPNSISRVALSANYR